MSRQKKQRRDQTRSGRTRGFSLVEVLITQAVVSLVLIGVFSVYSSSTVNFANQSLCADAISDNRILLSFIAQDIKEAIQVLPGPVTVGGLTYTSSDSCLILKVPSIDQNRDLIDIGAYWDTIIYRKNPSYPNRFEKIVIPDGLSSRPGGSRLLMESLDSFVLVYIDDEGNTTLDPAQAFLVDITVISAYQGYGREFHDVRNTCVKLRNKSS